MKKNIIFSVVLLIVAFSPSIIFADWVVCIDAGHGGPGADKYTNGGDLSGTAGKCIKIAEQWVNFNVACELRYAILQTTMYNVVMTRQSEADPYYGYGINEWDRNLWKRARIANYAKAGLGDIYARHADQFISIHHNGWDDSLTQGIEVFWCSKQTTDSGYSRCYVPSPLIVDKEVISSYC